MNFQPQNANPDQPKGPAKYQPQRTTPSMAGQQAPIPGAAPADAGRRVAAEREPAEQEQLDAGEGAEGEGEASADMSWRLGLVARKDKLARDRLEAAKAAEGRLKAAEARLAEREQRLQAEEGRRTEWRRNPKQLLADHGYIPEAALQFMLSGEKLTPEQALAADLDQRLEQTRRETRAELDARLAEEQRQREEQDAETEKQRQADLSEQEQIAVQELKADIGDILSEDAKAFPILVDKGERGLDAVYAQINALSDEHFQKTGRRPPITTKLIERAARAVEEAAADEIRKEAEKLGYVTGSAPMPRRATTLGQRLPRAQEQQRAAGGQETETYAERVNRVKAIIEPMLRGGRAR